MACAARRRPARSERQAITDLRRLASQPIRLPTPDEVMRRFEQAEALLEEDPIAGREEMRRYFADGKIRLELGADGFYEATYHLLPTILLAETTKPASGLTGGGPYTLVVAGQALPHA